MHAQDFSQPKSPAGETSDAAQCGLPQRKEKASREGIKSILVTVVSHKKKLNPPTARSSATNTED